MNQELMDKTKNGVFQMGSRFVEIVGSAIFNVSGDKLLELEVDALSKRVLDYLKTHKTAYVSDLSDKLDVPPTKIILAIRKLEKEGLVK